MMPSIIRSIEVHRLTISGLPTNISYGNFLRRVYRMASELSDRVYEAGDKSHAIHSLRLVNQRLLIRFLSFTTGFRPDILDTNQFVIGPNPLRPNQTGVDWTHVFGGQVGNRYVLLVEKVRSGIAPGSIEDYFQWFTDKYYEVDDEGEDEEPISLSLEYEPGEEFITRLDRLTRITKATIRKVRPNPGWGDLESELATESEASDAQRAEVTFTARRRASLFPTEGIVLAIRSLFSQGGLDYAAVEGERDGRIERFNTARLNRRERLQLETDENGQVLAEDTWEKMGRMYSDLSLHV